MVPPERVDDVMWYMSEVGLEVHVYHDNMERYASYLTIRPKYMYIKCNILNMMLYCFSHYRVVAAEMEALEQSRAQSASSNNFDYDIYHNLDEVRLLMITLYHKS